MAKRPAATARALGMDPSGFRVEDVQDGWHIRAWIRIGDGQLWITELHVRSAAGPDLKAAIGPDGPKEFYPYDPERPVPVGGITADVLRGISLRALYGAVGQSPTDAVTLSAHGLSVDDDFLALRRPGRRGRPDVFYAAWAERYAAVCATTAAPFPALVEQYPGFGERTIRDFIHKARQRRLLLGGSKGRAGGRLSAKAQRLLAEAKEEEA